MIDRHRNKYLLVGGTLVEVRVVVWLVGTRAKRQARFEPLRGIGDLCLAAASDANTCPWTLLPPKQSHMAH